MSKNIKDIATMFQNDTNRNTFKQFIEYFRFPFYKNFERDLKLNFTFPITFLTGANGSGKSSILHALYGSPGGKSIADYWYTTDLDPINDLKKNRHCFIYSYKTEFTKTQVEVLKTRIKRKDKRTGKTNPDYWEPSRAIKSLNMQPPPEDADTRETSGKEGQRWKLLKRNIYYMDFRYSLSAYDKYFYFGSKPNTKTLKTKQDIIRKYAPKLKKAFDEDKKISFYKRSTNIPKKLDAKALKYISDILGKNYVETTLLEHDFYNNTKGFAIKYKTSELIYSEAFAGSGETAVVKLVNDILSVEDYSLVILDEPETSLHPAAQKKLIEFLLKKIKIKKLQVVISSHSPDMIENMPKEAIKILYENPRTNKINIIEDVVPESAFLHLGHSIPDKKILIVEDDLAKVILQKTLEKNNDCDLFDIQYFPGGESRIKQENMLVYSKEEDKKHFIIFDGDQRKDKIDTDNLSNADKNLKSLKLLIKGILGEDIKFNTDGGDNKEQQEIDLIIKYLNFHKNNTFFLPENIPEETIWSNQVLENSDITKEEKKQINDEEDFKLKF
ncbi:MAG: AAA family ATPase, partial [Spirochaetes bacterium]|nr:AAA family ATPase [Spirochaetota bacterium]